MLLVVDPVANVGEPEMQLIERIKALKLPAVLVLSLIHIFAAPAQHDGGGSGHHRTHHGGGAGVDGHKILWELSARRIGKALFSFR